MTSLVSGERWKRNESQEEKVETRSREIGRTKAAILAYPPFEGFLSDGALEYMRPV